MPPVLIAVLLGLGYALVTAVLTVLSHQANAKISRHELIRKTRTRRLQYELVLLQRQKELRADLDSDVDFLDDDPAGVAGAIHPVAGASKRRAA